MNNTVTGLGKSMQTNQQQTTSTSKGANSPVLGKAQQAATTAGISSSSTSTAAAATTKGRFGSVLQAGLSALNTGAIATLAKVTEALNLILGGKNNQYIRFINVLNDLIKQLDVMVSDADRVKDPVQLRATLEEIKSGLQTVQIQARTLDELSSEKNKMIREKVKELEEKLKVATNTLAEKYAILMETEEFKAAKNTLQTEEKTNGVKPGEMSLDDLLGCIEVEASHALGCVNLKSDIAAAEQKAKELEQTDQEKVTPGQVAETLKLAAAAESSRIQALESFKRDVAAAPNMKSSLLTKATNFGGFKDLIRKVLKEKELPKVIQTARAKGDTAGIQALQAQNKLFAEKKAQAEKVEEIIKHPETIEIKLTHRQQEFMDKVNKTINSPDLPDDLKKKIQEMASHVLNVLSAIERVTIVAGTKLEFTAKMNKSELFGLAQIYSEYCDFYVMGFGLDLQRMEKGQDVTERGNIYRESSVQFQKSGYEDLFLYMRNVTVVPVYDHFENDISDIVGVKVVQKCLQDIIEAMNLYKKLGELLGTQSEVDKAIKAIKKMNEKKELLKQKDRDQELALEGTTG